MRPVAIIAGVCISLVLAFSWAQRGDAADFARKDRHRCIAPCVVVFTTPDVQEDEVCWDFRGNGTIRVWRDDDADCWG